MIEFTLPLPPSKNKRRIMVRGRPFQAPEVKAYREEVGWLIRKYKGKLPDNEKIVVECWWFKSRSDQDCSNWHDELCDAIAPALGLNDKWFLVRDMDFDVRGKDRGGVCVRLSTKKDHEAS